MNIYEVMEYGSIVYSNEEYGVLITANSVYFNYWVGSLSEGYHNTDCLYLSENILNISLKIIMEYAEKYFNESIEETKE